MILLMNSKLSEHDLLHSGRFGAARIFGNTSTIFFGGLLGSLGSSRATQEGGKGLWRWKMHMKNHEKFC